MTKNNKRNYDKIKQYIVDGRMAGLISWGDIVDRTRKPIIPPDWKKPQNLLEAAISNWEIDRWANQPFRPIIWTEKDAVIEIVQAACEPLGVECFSCRGYPSVTSLHDVAQRFARMEDKFGQEIIIFHLSDHDPSGMQMAEAMQGRFDQFGWYTEIERIGLTWEQIEELDPPPNPVKDSDARSEDYIAQYGHECYELDALSPSYIHRLITETIENHKDDDKWEKKEQEYQEGLRWLKSRLKD